MQDLPTAVVDNDASSLTRNFIRQLDATELGKTIRYDDYASAREAMQSGKVTAICVLPENMYSDVLAGRKPTASFYLNTMYYVGGMMSYKNLLTMFNLSIGAVQRETLRAMGMAEDAIMAKIQPIVIDVHQIGNTTTDYNAYLSNILLPGLLELLTIVIVAYAIGTEIKYGTSRQLLEMSGGSLAKALVVKLIPYTIMFSVLGCALMLVLYGPMNFPLAGSVWAMMLNIVLMVLASEAFAICIVSLLPVYQRLPRHPRILALRIHSPSRADAGILQGHGGDVPAQAILQFLCTGDDFRLRICRLVERSAALPCISSRSPATASETEERLHIPQLPKGLTL